MLQVVKPAPFDYSAPAHVDEALALLHDYSDACRVLAGGQSLVPLLSLRLARFEMLVDINRVAGLSGIEDPTANSSSARLLGRLTSLR